MASKYTEEQKLAAVQAYIRGEGGIRQVARNHEVSRGALIQWVAHYKQNGRLPPSSQQQENTPVQTPQNSLPPRSSLQFRLEVLYWQQVHHASDLKTAVTFQLRGMEIVSKWRRQYLDDGRLRLFRDRDGSIKTRRKVVTVKTTQPMKNN
ncbi:MAG: transposase [Spirochaetaceae bacterium]|nr:transposase [Spirochaetaceae bacterium]